MEPTEVNYVAYDGGGELLAGILGGDVAFAATGVGEVTESAEAGDVRILAVTSEEAVEGVDAPTLTDEGVDLVFANWRGIVAPPGISDDETQKWVDAITEMHDSDGWKTGARGQRLDRRLHHRRRVQRLPHRGERPRRGRHERAGPGMSSAAPGGTREQGRSEYGVALFLGALGLLVIVAGAAAAREPDRPRARSAPPPSRSSSAACWSSWPASWPSTCSRGGRGEPEGGEDVELTGSTDWRTVLMLAAAFVANALLIEPLGWPFSGAILFFGLGLRTRQPALHPGRGDRARAVLRLLVPVRLRPRRGPAGRHPEGHPLMDALTELIERLRHRADAGEPAVRLHRACSSAPRSACCPASARP